MECQAPLLFEGVLEFSLAVIWLRHILGSLPRTHGHQNCNLTKCSIFMNLKCLAVLESWVFSRINSIWLFGTYSLAPTHSKPSLMIHSSLCFWNHLSPSRAPFKVASMSLVLGALSFACALVVTSVVRSDDWSDYFCLRDIILRHSRQYISQEVYFLLGDISE